MRLRWRNIIVTVLTVVASILLVWYGEAMARQVSAWWERAVDRLSNGDPLPVVIAGLVVVLLIAVARRLCRAAGDRP